MANTQYGFDGSLGEAQWSKLIGYSGVEHVFPGLADLRPTAPATGTRQVTIATGTFVDKGTLLGLDPSVTLTLDAPSAGQWHLIVGRTNWNTNSFSIVDLPGAVTTTTIPTAIPAAFPSGMSSVGGDIDDAPIAWAWVSITNTTVVLVDVRNTRIGYISQGVWGPYGSIPFGPTGARDAWYKVATNSQSIAGQNYTQGATWFNTTTDAFERYYGLYDPATNLTGATTPGWYPAYSSENTADSHLLDTGTIETPVQLSPGGVQRVIKSGVVTVAVPTWVDVILYANLQAASGTNIAGPMTLRLDGNTAISRRYRSLGASGNTGTPWQIDCRMYLTPGAHTIAFAASIDSGSSGSLMVQDSQIHVWRN